METDGHGHGNVVIKQFLMAKHGRNVPQCSSYRDKRQPIADSKSYQIWHHAQKLGDTRAPSNED